MIISDKWKYIFVGLPFSASSAISKELVELYDGQTVSWKHSNITYLKERKKDISGYFVFAVYRNPVEIAFAHYNKILTNAYEVFTKPEYFRENGGWVSRRARRIYAQVREKDMDFDGYLSLAYTIPYDSVFSMNRPYLDYIINFDDIAQSFQLALQRCGIEPVRELPLFNKTAKPGRMNMKDVTFQKVFAPFLHYNKIPLEQKPRVEDKLLYRVIQPVRFWNWKKTDRAMQLRTVDDYNYMAVNN